MERKMNNLVPSKERKVSTSELKARLREQLKEFAFANPVVKDYDAVGGGMRPIILNIFGDDQKQLEASALKVADWLKKYGGLLDQRKIANSSQKRTNRCQ